MDPAMEIVFWILSPTLLIAGGVIVYFAAFHGWGKKEQGATRYFWEYVGALMFGGVFLAITVPLGAWALVCAIANALVFLKLFQEPTPSFLQNALVLFMIAPVVYLVIFAVGMNRLPAKTPPNSSIQNGREKRAVDF